MFGITTKAIGDRGEKLAADFLKKNGYSIVKRNFRCPHGEIDIIAENRDCLVFAEVKSRKDDENHFINYGFPAEAVTQKKQEHIVYTARYYLEKHPSSKNMRFDVLEVYLGAQIKINHIEDAFRL